MFGFVWTSFDLIGVIETRDEVLVDTRLVCDTNTGHREVCVCIISIQGRHGEILSLDIRRRQITLNPALPSLSDSGSFCNQCQPQCFKLRNVSNIVEGSDTSEQYEYMERLLMSRWWRKSSN